MSLVLAVFLLLICLLISNVISHSLPLIPAALIQVLLGVALSPIVSATSFEFNMETSLFLLLFVAPLLYHEGRHYPREALWKMRAQIFGNAVILVLLTTIGGGYLIHWIIPDIPLAASFALAAILSPTDPVAVNGITKRFNIPSKVMNIVKGESLINDASALVGFKYATIAVMTGYFSFESAAKNFIYIFTLGAISGIVLGTLITWTIYSLRKRGITDAVLFSLISLMTPFFIYFVSEHLLHSSGVIAVVVAGILHSLISDSIEFLAPDEIFITENLWSITTFTLNGFMFLLLGINIPTSMKQTVMDSSTNNFIVIWYVVAVGLSLFIIRLLWTYLTEIYYYYKKHDRCPNRPTFRISVIMALTGVRGAVTMAAVLSLPYVLSNGELFKSRSLMLFITAGVILLSLVMATIFLPILSRGLNVIRPKEGKMTLVDAKRKILLNVIRGIKKFAIDFDEQAADALMQEYISLFSSLNSTRELDTSSDYLQNILEVRLIGLHAERKYIDDMLKTGHIDLETFEMFEKALNYLESTMVDDLKSNFIYVIRKAIREWIQNSKRPSRRGEDLNLNQLQFSKYVQIKAAEYAIKKIEEHVTKGGDANIARTVVLDYKKSINKLKTASTQYSEKIEQQKEALRIKVVDMERHEIHKMYESGEITSEQAKELRRFINYTEIVTLYEYGS